MYTVCAYTTVVECKWDPRKARSNLKKHSVDFADAVVALEDENALTIEDKDHTEQRFKTLGMDPYLNVLLVIHVEITDNCIQIISARKAEKKQAKQYFKGLDYYD